VRDKTQVWSHNQKSGGKLFFPATEGKNLISLGRVIMVAVVLISRQVIATATHNATLRY